MESGGASGVPQAPTDPEQRNIIDKLAQFVARNGPGEDFTELCCLQFQSNFLVKFTKRI